MHLMDMLDTPVALATNRAGRQGGCASARHAAPEPAVYPEPNPNEPSMTCSVTREGDEDPVSAASRPAWGLWRV